jgi:hypothetical protein
MHVVDESSRRTWSATCGCDEVGTVARLRQVRAERLQPVLDRREGGSLT